MIALPNYEVAEFYLLASYSQQWHKFVGEDVYIACGGVHNKNLSPCWGIIVASAQSGKAVKEYYSTGSEPSYRLAGTYGLGSSYVHDGEIVYYYAFIGGATDYVYNQTIGVETPNLTSLYLNNDEIAMTAWNMVHGPVSRQTIPVEYHMGGGTHRHLPDYGLGVNPASEGRWGNG